MICNRHICNYTYVNSHAHAWWLAPLRSSSKWMRRFIGNGLFLRAFWGRGAPEHHIERSFVSCLRNHIMHAGGCRDLPRKPWRRLEEVAARCGKEQGLCFQLVNELLKTAVQEQLVILDARGVRRIEALHEMWVLSSGWKSWCWFEVHKAAVWSTVREKKQSSLRRRVLGKASFGRNMVFTVCFLMQATWGVGFFSGISSSATCPQLSSLRRRLLGERHKRIIGGKNMVRWMTKKCLGSWVEVAIRCRAAAKV